MKDKGYRMKAEHAQFCVAVLVSGSGSNLQALLDDQHGYAVTMVLADRSSAYGVQRALQANVATVCVPLERPREEHARHAWEERVAAVLDVWQPDLIVMAGWMRVMSASFIDCFSGRIINQHPALLPDEPIDTYYTASGHTLPAIRGAHAVRDALRLDLPFTGCTVHWVTPAVDAGPVLARAEVPIMPDDDETTLHERIKAQEQRLIVDVVRRLADEKMQRDA
jgi:phosphoribosylglycinamide formyltransferase-1